MSETVTSRDGTRIAFERAGSGPPLILIDPAGHFRANSPFGDLADLLAKDFTVVRYDRRGRGDSTDTPPYAPAREVEDLGALVEALGGSTARATDGALGGATARPVAVFGHSSGCLVALHASAAGVPLSRLVLMEPPIDPEPADTAHRQREFTAQLAARTGADAVEFFLTSIGVPDDLLAGMRDTPHWEAMVSVAPTLLYDSLLSQATDADLLRRVRTPTLVLDSTGSGGDLTGMAATATTLIPNATARSLPGGWHGVAAPVLAPVVAGFLMEPAGRTG
jgi:pimeloyl-ACP methyl ester carboxylesterase